MVQRRTIHLLEILSQVMLAQRLQNEVGPQMLPQMHLAKYENHNFGVIHVILVLIL